MYECTFLHEIDRVSNESEKRNSSYIINNCYQFSIIADVTGDIVMLSIYLV